MIELPITIFNSIIFVSIGIGFTFGLLLIFTKRENINANRFLGFLPIIIALWNCWVLGIDFKLYSSFPYLNLIPFQYSLGLGPCVYFYTKYITNSGFTFNKNHLFHFVPVCIETFLSIFQGVEGIQNNLANYETITFFIFSPILQLCSIISLVIYGIKSLKLIKKYHIWLHENYSNTDRYNLSWLYRLLLILIVLWLLWVPYTVIDYAIFDYNLGVKHYYPLYMLMAIITIWISAEAFLRPEVILLDHIKKSPQKIAAQSDEFIEQGTWLKNQMERNLFYLNSELTLHSLAKDLNLHPNNLSKIINEGLQKSFSDFVNEYRVNAVTLKLNDPNYDHITLLGIGFDCGFSSKATFNRVFKKNIGKTPREYKDSLKNQL